MTKCKTIGPVLAVIFSAGATAAYGQTLDSGDTAWIATSSMLVLFMTIPGLALFYGGLVRANNVLSVLLQCFAITCIISVLWFVAGYSLAFGNSVSQLVGDTSRFFYQGLAEDALIGSVPESVFATFQLTFAIIAPALIVGAFVERMRFSAVLLFALLWSLLVYSPVAHWVWGGGWLGGLGFLDYAGGTVVHVTAGTAALVAAIVLGPRQGFPERTKPPHSMVLSAVGAAMLWVGWFGFNGGSALAANGDATMSIVVTQLSASVGALVWMGMEWARHGKPTALGAIIGVIAGLASITPAAGFVNPSGALAMALVGSFLCFLMTGFVKRTLKIDDSLDVFPVHAVGGGIGTVLVAVFASDALGMFAGQHRISVADQVAVQALGVIAVAAYTALMTAVILKVVGAMVSNRVSAKDETDGLDLVLHGERGYALPEAQRLRDGNAKPARRPDSEVPA
ncbi:MAG: ammonium transporter [Gammaproteobacteria bacterium]|nr:ammonium transporter [Gammaproteobacteria bacterium]